MKRSSLRTCLRLGLALSAAAPAGAQEIYTQGGTQGGGIGAALALNAWAGVRADLDGFNMSRDFHAGGNSFDGRLKVRHAGLYLDLFLLQGSGVRVTGGVIFNDDRLNGKAVPRNGYYYLDGQRIAALPGQTTRVTVRHAHALPYLGIGFGHQPTRRGLGLVADIGVAYGRPRESYDLPPLLTHLAPPALIADEQASVHDSVQRYRFYPIAQIGLSYRF